MNGLLNRIAGVAAICLIGFAQASSANNLDKADLATMPSQSTGLRIQPVRQWYDMTVDFNTEVGKSKYQYGFDYMCYGARSTTVTLTHDNPRFDPKTFPQHMECESWYMGNFVFSPTEAGLTIDNITLTSELGTATLQLVGNGVIRETPESWIADLGEGSSPRGIAYDNRRDLVYIADAGNEQVIVFSPDQRSVVARVNVGLDPVGLAISPDGQKLYAANSGEHSISVIDLNTRVASKIVVPTLYPDPDQDDKFNYMPYEIAVVSDTLALLGSLPPGWASGGPVYQLDLVTHEVAPRKDLSNWSQGTCPQFATSDDFTTTGMVLEPGASPSVLARYSTASNSFTQTRYRLERHIAVNNNGTRMVTTLGDANALAPNLTFFDQEFRRLDSLQLLGYQSIAVLFNPVSPNHVYTVEDREPIIEEARLDLGRQTRAFAYTPPSGYGAGPIANALAISGDGVWVYVPLVQTWYAPPSKLLAVKVGPPTYVDKTAPSSTMNPLPAIQTHNWWPLSWSGTDDGSGIDHYEIQYRTEQDTTWTHWIKTSDTSALFANATSGRQYCFRLIAVDRAGNIEPYPDGCDIVTVAGSDTSGLSHTYLPLISKN